LPNMEFIVSTVPGHICVPEGKLHEPFSSQNSRLLSLRERNSRGGFPRTARVSARWYPSYDFLSGFRALKR
jgi:hypothetical protein